MLSTYLATIHPSIASGPGRERRRSLDDEVTESSSLNCINVPFNHCHSYHSAPHTDDDGWMVGWLVETLFLPFTRWTQQPHNHCRHSRDCLPRWFGASFICLLPGFSLLYSYRLPSHTPTPVSSPKACCGVFGVLFRFTGGFILSWQGAAG